MQHHAFVIEAPTEEGIELAQQWAKRELQIEGSRHPDLIVLRYGLFSIEDARKVGEYAGQGAILGKKKVIIIAANRAYHEAQNALLKLFEEPSADTILFLVLPSLGGLLPTLRSRVQVLGTENRKQKTEISEAAQEFLKASREKRTTIAKKLATGKDEEDRRENRDEAIAILNGVEELAYTSKERSSDIVALLSDISTLRGYLYDRSAPVRMILEHLALVIPKGLGK